jgi:ribosomal protein L29
MKFKELTTKSATELQSELARLRKELHELSIKLRTGEVKNVRSAAVLRKDIARILTLLTSK